MSGAAHAGSAAAAAGPGRIDPHIVAAITAGATSYGDILKWLQRPEFASITFGLDLERLSRLVDRRLQALRRAGRVRYENRVWSVVDTEPVRLDRQQAPGALQEAIQLLSAYRQAPKFGRDRAELQGTMDLEDRIDAFLAAQEPGRPSELQRKES